MLHSAENGAVVGPWVADDPAAAQALLIVGLSRLAGEAEIKLFVPPPNAAALELAREAGFEPERALRHMIRGLGNVPRPMLFGRANVGQG